MYRVAIAFLSAMSIAVVAPRHAWAQGAGGTWKVTYVTGGTLEQTPAIVKITTDGGKSKGEMVFASPRYKNLSLKSATQEGSNIRVVLMAGTIEYAFNGVAPKEATKQIKGVLTAGNAMYPAWLSATDDTTLDQKASAQQVDCPPMLEARTLSNKSLLLRAQAQSKKVTAEKKKELIKQAMEADQVARKETPRLYREVIAKYPDSPA